MSPTKLRDEYRKRNPNGHFFTENTMAFFGDSMENYRVNDAGAYWELERKEPVKNGLQSSHYFHKNTFEHITQMTYDRRMLDARESQ